MKLQTIMLALFAAAVLVSGCATSDGRFASDGSRYGSVRSNEGYYAVIESIESRPAANNGNAIAGAIIGGVIGGVAAHQVGSGRGNDVATVAGAAGGALVGHEIGRANERQDLYAIRVRFDDNSYQTVTQASLDGLRVGDSVRIERNRVRRY
jgi:outer membrane lipoprotein SlyB